MISFSVLISIYCRENSVYFREALDSIFSQTLLPSEIVLVKDGKLTPELDSVIDEYVNRYPIFKILVNEENLGLGLSLAKGVLACSNEYIARMDTDDTMPKDRFEKEFALLEQDNDVVSCWSALYDETMDTVVAIKKRPASHDEIVRLAKRRSPLCHAGSVFRRSAVLRAGNYQHCNLYEDYHLWVRMLVSGCRFSNVQKVLYNVRTSGSMINRRGGWKYAINELRTFFFFYKLRFYSLGDLIRNSFTHFPIRIMPMFLRSTFINLAWNKK